MCGTHPLRRSDLRHSVELPGWPGRRRGAGLGTGGGGDVQLVVNDISDSGVAGVELPGQQQLGQLPLDGAPQRAGAELGLETAVGQPVQRRLGDLQSDPLGCLVPRRTAQARPCCPEASWPYPSRGWPNRRAGRSGPRYWWIPLPGGGAEQCAKTGSAQAHLLERAWAEPHWLPDHRQ